MSARRGEVQARLKLGSVRGVCRIGEGMPVSHAQAPQVDVDGRLAAGRFRIEDMAGGAGPRKGAEYVIVLADNAHRERTDRAAIDVGSGAGAVGLIGAGLSFLPWRRGRGAVPARWVPSAHR